MAEAVYFSLTERRAFLASFWNIAQVTLGSTLRLLSSLAMARLVSPDVFGLMALVVSVSIAFELFSDIGIQRSIIRDEDGDTADYLRAAWVLKIFRGTAIAASVLAVALLTWLLAPKWAPSGTIYADPLLPLLLASISIVPILEAAKSTNAMLAMRIFHNGRSTFLQLIGQAGAVCTQVCVALIWPSVWALMIGLITGNVIRLVLSHMIFEGPSMAWRPDPKISARIWSFGKFLMASSTLTFLATNMDKFALASLMDSETFGLYSVSAVWISFGQSIMNKISNNVIFSIFGEATRSRPEILPKVLPGLQVYFDLMALFLFSLTFFAGEAVLSLLYTESYSTSGKMVTLLSLVFLSSRFATMDMFILNHGNSRAMMISSGIRATAILIFLPLGYNLIGIEGALLAVALTPLSSAPYTIWLIRPLLGEGYAARQVLWVVAILLTAVAVYLTY